MLNSRICYRKREQNAGALLRDSLQNSAWSRGVDADVWSSRIADLEERVVSAKRYAASMLEILEKA